MIEQDIDYRSVRFVKDLSVKKPPQSLRRNTVKTKSQSLGSHTVKTKNKVTVIRKSLSQTKSQSLGSHIVKTKSQSLGSHTVKTKSQSLVSHIVKTKSHSLGSHTVKIKSQSLGSHSKNKEIYMAPLHKKANHRRTLNALQPNYILSPTSDPSKHTEPNHANQRLQKLTLKRCRRCEVISKFIFLNRFSKVKKRRPPSH